MFPRVAIPVIALWLIAVVLAVFVPNDASFLGMSHHTYTGILFVVALIVSIVLFVRGSKSAA